VDGLVAGLSSQEKQALFDRRVRQELILTFLTENQVGLLKEFFLYLDIPYIPFFPPTHPREALLHADAVFRAGLLQEEILFLVGKDADGDATSLLSGVNRRIAKMAFVGLHLTPRNRFVILTRIVQHLSRFYLNGTGMQSQSQRRLSRVLTSGVNGGPG
jgi:hypothetical protein